MAINGLIAPNFMCICRKCLKYLFTRIYHIYVSLRKKREPISFEFLDLLADMDTSRPLKVLVHGWSANKDHVATAPIKNAYLAKNMDNLVVVDWSQAAAQPYDVARGLVPKVGIKVGELLSDFMEKKGIQPEMVHVIGHRF